MGLAARFQSSDNIYCIEPAVAIPVTFRPIGRFLRRVFAGLQNLDEVVPVNHAASIGIARLRLVQAGPNISLRVGEEAAGPLNLTSEHAESDMLRWCVREATDQLGTLDDLHEHLALTTKRLRGVQLQSAFRA